MYGVNIKKSPAKSLRSFFSDMKSALGNVKPPKNKIKKGKNK